jgi:uncharacterized membrane protein YccC
MTIQEALNVVEKQISEKHENSKDKLYQKFVAILSQLKEREFSADQKQALEKKLDELKLSAIEQKDKKQLKQNLTSLLKFLKEELSLLSKGHYTSMGIGLGSTFGLLFGIVFLSSLERSLGIALGLSLGMIIGLSIGRRLDAQAEAAGTVI